MELSRDLYFTSESNAAAAATIRAAVRSDPVTILRVAEEIGRNRGVWPAEAVTSACREEAGLLGQLPRREIRQAIEAALLPRDVDAALEWLLQIGVIDMFLPSLAATRNLAQEAGRRHKDVWEHTKLVVRQSVKRPNVRWAALLHDIGKVPTRRFTKNGVHFHGHAEVGARMFDDIAKALPFDNASRRKIRFLIKYHLRSNQYSADWTDSAVRRFAREMDEHLTDLLDLSRADITSQRPGRRQALLRQISALAERIERVQKEDAKVPVLPTGLGTAIIEHFSLPAGKIIGDLKRTLESAIDSSELEAHREAAYYLHWLKESGHIPKP